MENVSQKSNKDQKTEAHYYFTVTHGGYPYLIKCFQSASKINDNKFISYTTAFFINLKNSQITLIEALPRLPSTERNFNSAMLHATQCFKRHTATHWADTFKLKFLSRQTIISCPPPFFLP